MNYTREQLDGNILIQGQYEYIIEYLDGDKLQFYIEDNPSKKYKDYNTKHINDWLKDGSSKLKFRNSNNYEIY